MRDDHGLYDPRPYEDEDVGAPDAGGGYRIRSDGTWDRARSAYLERETAESVCFRFDLSLGAFRERARKGGWRRCDQPDREPLPVTAEDDIDFDADYAELATHALRQMRRAMARGRASAAATWMRLHDRLSSKAAEAQAAEVKARAVPRPVSIAVAQFNEGMEAQRREAEAYVARRDGTSAVEMASSVAVRVGDLARRMAAADPRDGVGRAAIERELDRLQAEILSVRFPDAPDLPHPVFAGSPFDP